MKNSEVRFKIFEAGLKHWQIAEVMKIHEGNLSRLLRKQLNQEQKKRVSLAIEKAKKMKEEGLL